MTDGVKQVLLIVGSAKLQQSTSEVLGSYLLDKLIQRGWATETRYAHKTVRPGEARSALLSSVDNADLVILAAPLFVDALPYPVTGMLEQIAENRRGGNRRTDQSLLCILNCGFPEAHQNETAIAICRQFAREAGFEWAGGLALGGGEAINGRGLFRVRGLARNVIKSLDLAAQALADGKPIPEKAVDLMAKPLMPRWLYILMGSSRWKREAKAHGVYKKLLDKPYLQ
jgi:hypothetical protein